MAAHNEGELIMKKKKWCKKKKILTDFLSRAKLLNDDSAIARYERMLKELDNETV